jgi:cell division protein FtsW (lipid II flippase)
VGVGAPLPPSNTQRTKEHQFSYHPGTLWIVGLNRKIFISGFIIIILCLPFIFTGMKPYQKQRVVNFFNSERDPLEQIINDSI